MVVLVGITVSVATTNGVLVEGVGDGGIPTQVRGRTGVNDAGCERIDNGFPPGGNPEGVERIVCIMMWPMQQFSVVRLFGDSKPVLQEYEEAVKWLCAMAFYLCASAHVQWSDWCSVWQTVSLENLVEFELCG